MPFTNFCCRSGGSNLNAGTRTGNGTVPGTAADLTYAGGNWVQATGVFTVASGNPITDGVAVGDFASVYANGSTITGFVGRVTARDATTITVSLTAKSGTAPANGTGDRTLKIGGAWQGPNGASGFPFNFIDSALVDASSNYNRVNFKNDAAYSITAAITHPNTYTRFQGFTTTYGDGGRATIDGGTSGASYILLTYSGNGRCGFWDLIFQNNGASGTSQGVHCSGHHSDWMRCVFANVRGSGFNDGAGTNNRLVECEAYGCNQSNAASQAGFNFPNTPFHLVRCVSHDNTGSNTSGFRVSNNGCSTFNRCIADSNGNYGFEINTQALVMSGCDAYNNGASGLGLTQSSQPNITLENCNFVKNGGYGILSTNSVHGQITKCGFGSGTQANTSGAMSTGFWVEEIGTVTYPADTTPWADPANGDFRINLTAAKNAGRGAFTQTQGGYAGAIGYPDIGAAQHLEVVAGGGARVLGSTIIRGQT